MCRFNRLTTLDLSGCGDLKTLDVAYNSLGSLDLSPCLKLRRVGADGNNLASISDLSSHTNMRTLSVKRNQLIELPALPPRLMWLGADRNQLAALPPALPPSLEYLNVCYNAITQLPSSLPPSLLRFYA